LRSQLRGPGTCAGSAPRTEITCAAAAQTPNSCGAALHASAAAFPPGLLW